jgi:hypothetical protein
MEHNSIMNKTFKINAPILLSEKNSEGKQSPAAKCQLMKTGVFSYWEPGDVVISSEMFLSFCDNFNKKVRGTDLAIDYGHNAFEEAAGWIKSLSTNEDRTELWADIEWTPKGAEALINQEYRYISAEFSYKYEDESGNQCGPTLYGAGLTNRPFLKNMQPLNLDEKRKNEMEKKLAELQDKFEKQSIAFSELNKKLADRDAEIKKLNEEKVTAEKNNEFNKMLSAGKVCEAQREAFLSGDVQKFAALSQPVKLSNVGHGDDNKTEDSKNLTPEQAEDKMLKLSEELMAKEEISFRDAVKKVRKENPDLVKKADEKFE